MNDDELMEEMVKSGKTPQDMEFTDEMAEKLFGEKGPVKAVFKGYMEAQFDFDKEVEEAKEAYDEMLRKLEHSEEKKEEKDEEE